MDVIKRVLEENVVRGNQEGRTVETTDGKKVFLVGRTLESGGGGSSGGGGEGDARAAYEEALARRESEAAELLRQQNAREDEALRGYGSLVGSLERPDQIYGRLETERGIPQIQERTKAIRQRIADIEGLLGQLPEDITRRTAGTLTTSSQRNRILAKEQAPLAGQIAEGSRELGVESGNLADATMGVANLTNLTVQGQDRLLEPERMRISMMSDRAAREMTAFDKARESELNLLGQKLQRAGDLADQEWDRMNELADQSSGFERLKEELIQRSTLAREEAKYQNELDIGKSQFLDSLKTRGGGGGGRGSATSEDETELINLALDNLSDDERKRLSLLGTKDAKAYLVSKARQLKGKETAQPQIAGAPTAMNFITALLSGQPVGSSLFSYTKPSSSSSSILDDFDDL